MRWRRLPGASYRNVVSIGLRFAGLALGRRLDDGTVVIVAHPGELAVAELERLHERIADDPLVHAVEERLDAFTEHQVTLLHAVRDLPVLLVEGAFVVAQELAQLLLGGDRL